MEVFISYKREDREFVDRLAAALESAAAVRTGLKLDIWWDKGLQAGQNWDSTIKSRMESADIFVALATPQFFESTYIAEYEVPLMLSRWNEGHLSADGERASVVPVHYKGGGVGSNPLSTAKLQFFGAAQPLSELDANELGDALKELADRVCDLAESHKDIRRSTQVAPLVADHVAAMKELVRHIEQDANVSPEDQLKGPVAALLAEVSRVLSIGGVSTTTEQRGDHVRFDIAVRRRNLVVGMIELKGWLRSAKSLKSADPYDPKNWSEHDRQQWKVLADHPNLIYTNGTEWTLLRHGHDKPVAKVNLAAGDGQSILDFIALLGDFLRWSPLVPSQPKPLAAKLAPLTRLLRDDVLRDAQNGGDLASLHQEWADTILPDSSLADFADSYAQTFTYALLLAKIEGAPSPLRADKGAQDTLTAHGQSLLAAVLKVMGQDSARLALDGSVSLIESTLEAIDPSTFNRKGNQWIYFYEFFLQAYDPAKRDARGVYYTPVEIVDCQTRLAQHVLRDRMGTQGFADQSVRTLDPAVGTGSYLLSVVRQGVADAASPPSAAERLGQNIFGFEILVGPYAVAHLQLTRALTDAGAKMPADRGANIILTDSLSEPAKENPTKMSLFTKPLSEEHSRASRVKSSDTNVTVIIGNPPYNRAGDGGDERLTGGFVRHKDAEGKPPLLDAFIEPLKSVGAGGSAKNLYNDYVYFWRWAIWKACEQRPADPAVVTFITPTSFLAGPGFAGMRKVMREQFDEIWIVDLGGEGRGANKEPNVFDILTPVCITVAFRVARPKPRKSEVRPATTMYQRVRGDRAAKLKVVEALKELDADDGAWSMAPTGWTDPFIPVDSTDPYNSWPTLGDLMPWSGRGIQFSRSWPISESVETLKRRWRRLLESGAEMASNLVETEAVSTKGSPPSFHAFEALPGLETLSAGDEPEAYQRIWFRSFDSQWCIADRRVIDRPRPPMWRASSERQIYLSTLEDPGQGPLVVAAPYVPDLNAFNNRGGVVYPLFRDVAAEEANVTPALIGLLAGTFDSAVTAESLAAYLVGIAGTGGYAARYLDRIHGTVPRVPLTKDPALFEEAVALGVRLIRSTTSGLRFAETNKWGQPVPVERGSAREMAAIPTDTLPEKFSYSPQTETLIVGAGSIAPVTPAQWAFSVSGLPVISSWLGYRTAKRSGKTSSPLDAIRPEVWDQTDDLLALLATVETLVQAEAESAALLDRIEQGPLFTLDELPKPNDADRKEPKFTKPHGIESSSGAVELDL